MMMLLQALALALALQGAPSTAPAAAQAAVPDAVAPGDPAAELDQLRQMYADTCSAREYGAYDDMCDQLRQQVRIAERQAARAPRHAKLRPAPPPTSVAATPPRP